jgi:undecaprenyl-diphosphatase
MTFLQSLILGIIQGLTEFLPISSSAHLVLVPYILNWNIPESYVFPFDVLVQLGTLAAVIAYFWRDLITIIKTFMRGILQKKPFADPDARMGWYLVIATIPAGLAGILLKSNVEAAFNSPRITAIFLFVTALLLVLAEFLGKRKRELKDLNWKDALWIGVFQAFSIFPGISRSGSTIAGGMTRHLQRPAAARFAFLMSIPVMLAAGIFSIPDLLEVPNLGSFLPVLAVGFVAAVVVGYFSIRWLLSFLNKRSLVWFAGYCVLLALAVLIIGAVR